MGKISRLIIGIGFISVPILFFCLVGNTFLGNVVFGRVHFPRAKVGETLNIENGQKYKIFRRLVVNGGKQGPDAFAVFKVRFKFSGMKPEINKRLSIIPAPFLIGMKGFREKLWMYDEDSGYFQGLYQWESRETAELYPESFIFKVMIKRSAKGTLSFEIIPAAKLSNFILESQKESKNES